VNTEEYVLLDGLIVLQKGKLKAINALNGWEKIEKQ